MNAEEYATALALASAQVIAAVHRGDNTGRYIDAALSLDAPPWADPTRGLINLLAAQADPGTTLTERLAWCNQLDPAVVAACQRRAS